MKLEKRENHRKLQKITRNSNESKENSLKYRLKRKWNKKPTQSKIEF